MGSGGEWRGGEGSWEGSREGSREGRGEEPGGEGRGGEGRDGEGGRAGSGGEGVGEGVAAQAGREGWGRERGWGGWGRLSQEGWGGTGEGPSTPTLPQSTHPSFTRPPLTHPGSAPSTGPLPPKWVATIKRCRNGAGVGSVCEKARAGIRVVLPVRSAGGGTGAGHMKSRCQIPRKA